MPVRVFSANHMHTRILWQYIPWSYRHTRHYLQKQSFSPLGTVSCVAHHLEHLATITFATLNNRTSSHRTSLTLTDNHHIWLGLILALNGSDNWGKSTWGLLELHHPHYWGHWFIGTSLSWTNCHLYQKINYSRCLHWDNIVLGHFTLRRLLKDNLTKTLCI